MFETTENITGNIFSFLMPVKIKLFLSLENSTHGPNTTHTRTTTLANLQGEWQSAGMCVCVSKLVRAIY